MRVKVTCELLCSICLIIHHITRIDPVKINHLYLSLGQGGLCLSYFYVGLHDFKGFDVCDSLRNRQRFELEELRRQLEDNSALAGRTLKEELEKAREEQERRHQVKQRSATPLSFGGLHRLIQCSAVCEQAELKAVQERLEIDRQHWEENYKKKEVCHNHRRSTSSPSAVSREEIALKPACLEFQTFHKQEIHVKKKWPLFLGRHV